MLTSYREVDNQASLLKRSAVHGHPFIQDTLGVSRLDQFPCGRKHNNVKLKTYKHVTVFYILFPFETIF